MVIHDQERQLAGRRVAPEGRRRHRHHRFLLRGAHCRCPLGSRRQRWRRHRGSTTANRVPAPPRAGTSAPRAPAKEEAIPRLPDMREMWKLMTYRPSPVPLTSAEEAEEICLQAARSKSGESPFRYLRRSTRTTGAVPPPPPPVLQRHHRRRRRRRALRRLHWHRPWRRFRWGRSTAPRRTGHFFLSTTRSPPARSRM